MTKRKQSLTLEYDSRKFEQPAQTALDILVERILKNGCVSPNDAETTQRLSAAEAIEAAAILLQLKEQEVTL